VQRREVREILKVRPRAGQAEIQQWRKAYGLKGEEIPKRNQPSALRTCRNHLSLAGGVKQMPAMDTTARIDKFAAPNRQRCERYVKKMQRQIHKAVEAGNWRKARYLIYLLTRRSKATKLLATYKITTQNRGKHTAGVDHVSIPKGTDSETKRRIRLGILKQATAFRKPDHIRRTYIRKPNGKKRPLGIPVMLDRIAQDIIRMAIEPITEYHFDDSSYGFRPKRSCHDAIEDVFNKLSRNYEGTPIWIVEGDIKGCFSNIRHGAILDKARKWHIPEAITTAMERILKAKVTEGHRLFPSEMGTVQGGVISPMLANVALTELDEMCREWTTKKGYTPLVKYADDFIIVCNIEAEAQWWKEKVSSRLKEEVGLELSAEKTNITHISQGFDFLGFNVRKYTLKSPHTNPKLLIKPAKENVTGYLRDIRQTIKTMRQATTEDLIRTLNPRIQGWGLYYRHVVSKRTFAKIDDEIHQALWRWAKRRHPKKEKKWIRNRYFKTFRGNRWTFTGEEGTRLMKMASLPITRHMKLRNGMKVYASDRETVEYWQKREYKNALNQIYCTKVEKIYKRQKGICPCCYRSVTDISETHIHHMLPVKYGGTEKLNNLWLLHLDCHRTLHSEYSLKQMRDAVRSSRWYLQPAAEGESCMR
jgi:RNA-directed DNA polymerase